MYRVFIWIGAKRIQQVMEAKGYIIGTSQVSHCGPALVAMTDSDNCMAPSPCTEAEVKSSNGWQS